MLRTPFLTAVSALVVAGALPAAAGAAWTPPAPLPALSEAQVVAGPVPGQAAALGLGADGSVLVASHPAGGAWSPARTVVAAADTEAGVTGPGGTFAIRPDENVNSITAGRVDDAGQLVGPLAQFNAGDVAPEAVALAPDGSILVVVGNAGNDLLAHVVAPGATTATPVGGAGNNTVTAGDATSATAEAIGTNRFQVVWTNDPPTATPSSVRTRTVTTAAVGASQTLSDITDSAVTVAEPSLAVGPTSFIAAWIQSGAGGTGALARARSISAFDANRPPAQFAGNAVVSDISLTAAPSGLFALTFSGDGGASSGGVAVLTGAAAPVCERLDSFSRATAPARADGFALISGRPATGGLTLRGEQLASAPALCGVGPAADSTAMAGSQAIAAAGDAEGSVVAVTEGGSSVATLDETAPAAGTFSVPGKATAGDRPTVSATPADGWGLASITWAVDGAPVGTTPSVQLPALAEGRRTVTLTLRDAAGNATVREAAIDVAPRKADEDRREEPRQEPKEEPKAPPPAPTQEVELPGPAATAPAARPRVLSARVVRRRAGWFAVVRVSDADRVRLTLVRERYLSAAQLRARGLGASCGRTARHGRPGQHLRAVRRMASGAFEIRLSGDLAKALRTRGRYALRVAAATADGRRSKVTVTRFTGC